VNHNGNFLEHIKMQKYITVSADEDDEIINLIELHLDTAVNDIWFDEQWRPKNYDFELLPKKLKKYMHEWDMTFYNLYAHRVMNKPKAEDYNRRIERLEKAMPEYTDDDFEAHVLIGRPIPSTIGKKAKESARRAYRMVNALLKSNVNRFTHFVTFTFAPERNKEKHIEKNNARLKHEIDLKFDYVNVTDFDIAKEKFSQQMKYLAKTLREQNIEFEYLAVWEIQKNGAYHFHLLTTEIPESELYKVPNWLDYDHKEDKFLKGYGLLKWNYGKSDIQKIKNHAEISTYVSKYILKGFYNVQEENYDMYKGQKKYFASRGLSRSDNQYFKDDQVENELLKFDLSDINPYEKGYTNPYNKSLIVDKIYTLLDKKNIAVSLGREHDNGDN
jgi:hypothetical protein